MTWTSEHASLKNAKLYPRNLLTAIPITAPTSSSSSSSSSNSSSCNDAAGDKNNKNNNNNTQKDRYYQWADETKALPAQFFQPAGTNDRQPALWRCIYWEPSSNATTITGERDIARAIDGVAADWQHSSSSSSSSSSSKIVNTAKNRLAEVLIQRITAEWIPSLILAAILEECQSVCLQKQAPATTQAATSTTTATTTTTTASSDTNARASKLPLYYTATSGRSLEQQQLEQEQLEEDASPESTLLPGKLSVLQIVNRIKQGCMMAWHLEEQKQQQLLLQHHQQRQVSSPTTIKTTTTTTTTTTTRASRRLARNDGGGGGEGQEGSSVSTDATRRWPVQPGGLVATYLQQQLVLLQQEKEEVEKKEQEDATKSPKPKPSDPRSSPAKPSTDTPPDEKPPTEAAAEETAVQKKENTENKPDETAVVETGGESAVEDDEKTGGEDDDEEYENNEEDDDDDEDEEMQDVVQENVKDLEEDLIVETENEPNDEEEEIKEDEEEDVDVDLVLDSNPYLKVTQTALLEWLGRKTAKFLSTSELRDAIQSLLWTIPKKKKKPTGGTYNISKLTPLIPNTLWRKILLSSEQETDWTQARLAVDGDDDWDGESPQLGRLSLRLRVVWGPDVVAERAEQAAQAQLDALSRHKQIQAWMAWRYKGIGNGCTVWPKWKPDIALVEASPEHPETDLAVARELAPEDVPDTTSTRRSRRSAEGGVYYGNQSNMTQKQLMDAMLRIISAQPSSVTQLAASITDDSTDPIRRIRLALGKLLCKRRQIARMPPRDEGVQEPSMPETVQGEQEEGKEPTTATFDDKQEESMEKQEESVEKRMMRAYLQDLHQTELRLRQMVLKHLTEFPVAIIATSADERSGSLEAMDQEGLELKEEDWRTSGHDWIGEDLFRPPYTSHSDNLAPCQWYRVQAYSESVVGNSLEEEPAERPQIGTAKEPAAVERRSRFRVVSQDGNETALVLTEAQVFAGMKAAKLAPQETTSAESPANPFVGSKNVQITLVAPSGENSSRDVTGMVVGHDTVLDAESSSTHERILIVPDEDKQAAFWARLIFRKDGAIECKIEGADDTIYTVQQYEYHSSSPAFQECRAIVKFMERHASADPFLQPVDPVALNIPDYFNVIKNPMDISTVAANLENGKYSNIPPQQVRGHTPIARMLNGPFRRDVELIFDNAMLFNPPGDWVHNTAASFKRVVLRKIDHATSAAEGQGSRAYAKQSIYVDDDSDVDMYEYESDDDYNAGGSRSRKRKSSSGRTPIKEDSSTRSIERPFRVNKLISEQAGLRGPLSNMPVYTDATTFTLPPGWTCQRLNKEGSASSSAAEEKVDTELDSLIALHKSLQAERVLGLGSSRRTTRHHHPTTVADTPDFGKNKLSVVEYSSDPFKRLDGDNPPPRNRFEIEVAQERLHEEFFGKVYQDLSRELRTEGADLDLPNYLEGSFPPYLGRVVPPWRTSSRGKDLLAEANVRWEIRDIYLIPALRWVIRGLVLSEHLSELEPVDNTLSNGVVLPNHVYYIDPSVEPFDVVNVRELTRRKRATTGMAEASSDEEVELSEYEQRRAERVVRNAERLKALGLA